MKSIDEATNLGWEICACLHTDVDDPVEDRTLTVVRLPRVLLESR